MLKLKKTLLLLLIFGLTFSLTILLKNTIIPYDYMKTSVKVMGPSGHGSGVIVDTNSVSSLIITNKHVCKGIIQDPILSMQIRTVKNLLRYFPSELGNSKLKALQDMLIAPVGAKVKIKFALQSGIVEGTIMKVSKFEDLCLVRIPKGDLMKARLFDELVVPGIKIITHGHPLYIMNHITEGYTGNTMYQGFVMYRNHTAEIYPGNSGSGAFTMEGELIGINTQVDPRYKTFSMMVQIDSVKMFLEGEML